MRRHVLSVFVLAVALCGCGGSSGSVVPHSSGAASAASQNVAVSIIIPAVKAVAWLRKPAYVSTATQSAALAVNGGAPVIANLTPGSPNCSSAAAGLTCTVTIAAPIGTDTFNATLYANLNAQGSVLSQGAASATIVAATQNSVSLTLGGVVASVGLALPTASPVQAQAAQLNLIVTVKDAAGATIIGSDPYTTPIVLTDSDRSGATKLSKTTLTSPTDAATVTIAYDGSAIANAVFGATAGSIKAANVTLTPQAPVTFNNYTTFGYDNQRDVYNPNSAAITPASIGNVRLAWQAAIGGGDYNTQTQPVLATGISGHAGVLFVGGGSGRVFGYDALTGSKLWSQQTGQETYTCENSITFYFGVGGTAAYDPASKSLYVIGNSNASPNSAAANTLYHLDAATGAILGQVNVAPSVAGWPSLDFSHTSVTLANGIAYVGTGATCDISSWRGRIAAVSVPSMTLTNTFYTVWNGTTQPWGGGGVWGWGGVSLDFNGNVLTGVGNTDNGVTTHGSIVPPYVAAPEEYSGLGDAFIKLSPDLSSVEDSHHPTPTTAYSGNSVDLDIQGTPAVFQPNGAGCDPMAALQAKSGSLYLYDTARIGNGLVGQFQLAPSSYADGFLGGPAYSPATGLLYAAVTSSSSSLYAPGMIAIDPGCGTPSVTWHAAFGPDSYPSGTPRSVPAVSAGGVVFVGTMCASDGNGGCGVTVTSSVVRGTQSARRKPLICCAPAGTGNGAVWALNAATGEVLNSGKPVIITSATLRVPPTIDGNWIFVLDNSGNLYGLTIDANYAATSAVVRSADSRMLRRYPAPRNH